MFHQAATIPETGCFPKQKKCDSKDFKQVRTIELVFNLNL